MQGLLNMLELSTSSTMLAGDQHHQMFMVQPLKDVDDSHFRC